jgi:bifunctional enzyme CysN/CysC
LTNTLSEPAAPVRPTQKQNTELRVVIVGHVDHGKSTLVGRLLHDTGSLPAGKLDQIRAVCRRRGMPFEWAFLMDALQAERDQNVTIDVSHIWFRSGLRPYVIIDAPGHKEFLKNMVTGAAQADAALLLIAANEGVQEQSKRHAYLLSMLGVRQVIVLVNKMDTVGYDQEVFRQIEREYRRFLEHLRVQPKTFIPVAARDGVNLVERGLDAMAWYQGETLLESLDRLETPAPAVDQPLRFAVQDVYRFDERRLIAGRVEAGCLRVGDAIVFAPNNKEAVVASIERWQSPPKSFAFSGESVGLTLQEQVFVERGHIASHRQNNPVETNRFKAKVFWMGERPLALSKRYRLKLLTQEVDCEIASIDRVIDATSLESSLAKRSSVMRNEVAEITIQARAPLVMDNYDRIPASGRFVIVDERDVSGGGIVFDELYLSRTEVRSANISWSESAVSRKARAERNSHVGVVVWLTGLSGSGKSTLARALEWELFSQQKHVYVLDGDNVRHGLNANLGFAPEDRVENIRRVAEVAKLMADAGFIVLTSFISPYRIDRRRAREIVLSGNIDFIEVHVAAPLATCEARDPKNLYKKARAGEIQAFTGISAPYEEPENPEIRIHTESEGVEQSVNHLLEFLLPRLNPESVEYEI